MFFKKALSILILALVLSFPSCQKREYSDTLSCYDLCEAVIAAEDDVGEYEAYGEDYLEYFLDNTSLHDDFRIIYSRESEDIDELGIFHADSKEKTDELLAVVEKHISSYQKDQRSFIASYAPEELSKLDNAEIKVFGNYVVYAIMDEDDKKEAFSVIEKELKK